MNRAALHSPATERTRPGNGSGIASVDIQAWLLTLALAMLLRDDLSGWLPLQEGWSAAPPELSNHESALSGSELNSLNCFPQEERWKWRNQIQVPQSGWSMLPKWRLDSGD
jgi:hypothetical protein